MSYNTRTTDQQAAISHCKECKKDLYWSLELGLNVVAIYISLEQVSTLDINYLHKLREKFKNMIAQKLPDGSYLFISIWCPFCNRIQNKEVYTLKWKEVKHG
jgi:hypothetical protein